MNTVRFPLFRGSLFLIALAAIAFILARGDTTPAQASTYNPAFSVSVSDPNPGAAADLIIDFSVDTPDSFPNVKTNSSIQFLPKAWGIHSIESDGANAPPVGAMAGTFNALTNLGVFGYIPCSYPMPVPFTLYDASPYTGYNAATGAFDPEKLTSSLDLGGGAHPGGLGYSGQFAQDPDTVQPPGDLNLPLFAFNWGVPGKHNEGFAAIGGAFPAYGAAYRDMDDDGYVSVGDIRLTHWKVNMTFPPALEPGVVQEGDWDLWYLNFVGFGHIPLQPFAPNQLHTESIAANGLADAGEGPYIDVDGDRKVSYGDRRLFDFGTLRITGDQPYSLVEDSYLVGGITRYPDFLNQMFPPAVVGDPLARMLGVKQVLTTAVSLNIVTFRPGQLPGYPAQLGYPNVVVILNPVAPIEMYAINQVGDICTPLSLTSTNFGVSKDNPATFADESGYVRLTNPKAEKSHEFTLVTTSQPDADGDGIENMLDTCPLDPNTQDLDGRNNGGEWSSADPDSDALDGACDLDPLHLKGNAPIWGRDQDLDSYGNRSDNCATTPNGQEYLTGRYQRVPGFTFIWVVTGDLIGPDSQADTDGDDIGDACEGSEHGPQCTNAIDDDGDGVVNDGCATNGDTWEETGDQCLNDVDDDGDGKVNDGCPMVQSGGVAESGAQCDNAVDDDADGLVNDGCPAQPNAETGDQCLNDIDDDDDGKVNDGCPAVETGRAESGDECLNDTDDDGDGKVNDGCPRIGGFWPTERSWLGECDDAIDNDGDGYVNDGCPKFPPDAESGAQCDNAVDDDADGLVNDGCPQFPSANAESGAKCSNSLDDDYDGKVNDGCPKDPVKYGERNWAGECSDALDNDGDGKVNDGCPMVKEIGVSEAQCDNNVNDDSPDDSYINDGCPAVGDPETGDQCGNLADDDGDGLINDGCPSAGSIAETDGCANNLDDDADGLVNDGCPAVDPGDYAKTHITGEMVVRTLTQGVTIAKHGVKLDDLDGPESVAAGGSANYKVSVENKGGSAEDFPVALRVVEGCGVVTGPSTVHVNGDASANAQYTVDFSGCAAGEYTVQADACHAGDAAPAGLFGEGACPDPGTADGLADTNTLDDAPRSLTVVVGTP